MADNITLADIIRLLLIVKCLCLVVHRVKTTIVTIPLCDFNLVSCI